MYNLKLFFCFGGSGWFGTFAQGWLGYGYFLPNANHSYSGFVLHGGNGAFASKFKNGRVISSAIFVNGNGLGVGCLRGFGCRSCSLTPQFLLVPVHQKLELPKIGFELFDIIIVALELLPPKLASDHFQVRAIHPDMPPLSASDPHTALHLVHYFAGIVVDVE